MTAARNVLVHETGLLLYAVQFLTRVPVPAWVGHTAERLDRSTRYFPLVGALVGALVGGVAGLVYWLASLWLPHPAAVLAVGAGGLLWLMLRRLGGYTGDGLGAIEQAGDRGAGDTRRLGPMTRGR